MLSDLAAFGAFVVGTKHIRSFEPTWLAPGSVFHHTLGIGPFTARSTRVKEVDEDRRLVMRGSDASARSKPCGFQPEPADGGTEVEVEEYPIDGPGGPDVKRGLRVRLYT